MQEQQSEGGSSFMSFLLGGALGVIAGLLWAPRSGQETRERLQEWAENLQEKSQELYRQGREKVQEGAQKARRVVESGRNSFTDDQNT
jgi:gas vesicle protein